MNKQILYVGRIPDVDANPWLVGLREFGGIECKDVYQVEQALQEMDSNNYGLVVMGSLVPPMDPPDKDVFEHGLRVVRTAKFKGLSTLVFNSHGITDIDKKLTEIGTDAVFSFHSRPISYCAEAKRLLEKSDKN